MRKLVVWAISILFLLLLPLNAYANIHPHPKHTYTHDILPTKEELSDSAITAIVQLLLKLELNY